MKHHQGSQAGFSLIELSIGLVIIGLILGSILLKGGGLIESARLKAVLAQVNDIRIAVETFRERYGALPGDYDKAKAYINDSLIDGKNNGIIDGNGLTVGEEAFNFWAHLAKADLLNQMEEFSPELKIPSSKMGGAFAIQANPTTDMPGHWIVLGNTPKDAKMSGLLTPLQAMHLDQKIDTGDPTTGHFRVIEAEGSKDQCFKDKKYNIQDNKPGCVVYFKL